MGPTLGLSTRQLRGATPAESHALGATPASTAWNRAHPVIRRRDATVPRNARTFGHLREFAIPAKAWGGVGSATCLLQPNAPARGGRS
jgi:hypothetical protein